MKKEEKFVMVKPIIALIILVTLLILSGSAMLKLSEEKRIEPKKNTDITLNNNDFDLNILKYYNTKTNIIYSPLSIRYALNMLKEGADGSTLLEINNLIGDSKLPKYTNIEDALMLANAIYIRDTYKDKVKDEYTNALKNKYDAELIYDPFKNAKNVNSWISKKTTGIIKNMLSDEIVKDPNVNMLLVNALAINMKWLYKFDSVETYKSDFTNLDNKSLEVTMMHLMTGEKDITYYDKDNVTMISLPLKKYKDTELTFIAIMPNDDFDNYISNITLEDLNNMISKLHTVSNGERLNIHIPKFSYNFEVKMKEFLADSGLKKAFTDEADLTKMTYKNDLKVGNVIHKANIDFNEDGIKAAAATVVQMISKGALIEDKIINITFNKPFIYLIKDKNNDTIWFIGNVNEPNLWENDKAIYGY